MLWSLNSRIFHIATILTLLLVETNQAKHYYYPVAFGGRSRIYCSVMVNNENLTVNMQFSENFTKTTLMYIQQNANSSINKTYNHTVNSLPYSFTKFYQTQTEVKIYCYPTQFNINVTITLSLEYGKIHQSFLFNFIEDTQRQIFKAFQTQKRDQIITIFLELCICSWSGWNIGLLFQNGTKVFEYHNQSDIFCGYTNDSQVLNQYYLEQNVKVYPYLYRYNNFPVNHYLYIRFYVENKRYCDQKLYTINKAINQTHCQCDIGFIWVTQNDRCQRNCQFYNQTLGLQPNSTTQCACDNGERWNQIELRCQRDCLYYNYTFGLEQNSTTQCICYQDEKWNQSEIRCQRDCLYYNYSLGLKKGSRTQCICYQGEKWNQSELKCNQIHKQKQQANQPLLEWWFTILVGTVVLVVITVVSAILIKKAIMKNRITNLMNRSSINAHRQNSQQKIRVFSIQIIDFYQ